MTLAIVTTYYNEIETIDDVVHAISKAPQPFNFYLVDDCSSKPPTEVLEKYGKKPWFHYLRNKTNKGPVFGLNRGIKQALSDGACFIAINDADDISYDNRFQDQLQAFDQDNDLMMLGGAADFVEEKTGRALWQTRHPLKNADIHRKHRINASFVHSTVMYRAEVFKTIGFYREGYYALDYDMTARILAKGLKVGNLAQPILKYHVRQGSMSVSKRRAQIASRLRVQWQNFEPFNIWSLWGILRSILAYCTPNQAINTFKNLLYRLKIKFHG